MSDYPLKRYMQSKGYIGFQTRNLVAPEGFLEKGVFHGASSATVMSAGADLDICEQPLIIVIPVAVLYWVLSKHSVLIGGESATAS